MPTLNGCDVPHVVGVMGCTARDPQAAYSQEVEGNPALALNWGVASTSVSNDPLTEHTVVRCSLIDRSADLYVT